MLVVPYLKVLPMGWSWALHLCQQVLTHAIATAGFEESQIIGDKRAGVRLSKPSMTAVAGYVDNLGATGSSKHQAMKAGRRYVGGGLRRLVAVLSGWGLTVHEVEEAQLSGDFVGLHFDGSSGHVSVPHLEATLCHC